MPFPNHASVITGCLQHFRDGRLAAIKAIENRDAVDMAVFPRENRSAAWSANGINDETVHEPHPLPGNAVNVRSFIDLAPISADRMGRMVIGHDEQNVRAD